MDANDKGHNLGGSTSTASGPLTPAEVRQRRLAALERHNTPSTTTTTPPPTTTTTTQSVQMPDAPSTPPATATATAASKTVQISTPPTYRNDGDNNYNNYYNNNNNNNDDDDDSEQLQAALALSLTPEPPSVNTTSTRQTNGNDGNGDNDDDLENPEELAAALSLSMPKEENDDSPPTQHYSNLDDDDHDHPPQFSTVVAEWYKTEEPADVMQFHSAMWDSSETKPDDKLRWVRQGINFRDFQEGKLDDGRRSQTQSHSQTANDSLLAAVITNHGPWGLTQAHGGPCGVLAAVQAELLRILLFGGRVPLLEYPVAATATLTNHHVVQGKAADHNNMSEPFMKKALAMSMAMILARVALTPPAATDVGDDHDYEYDSLQKRSVRLCVPHASKIGTPLSWEDFEPWDGPYRKSSTLKVFTIAAPSPVPTEDDGGGVAPKRQKTVEGLEDRIIRLAHAVTLFFLEAPPGGGVPPLEAYRQPGGVVLLIMSLAFSRGTDLVHADMDDPCAKLTSTFGHCGQELINLLLTGQSVSNVFDNTLTPSGDLVCRGIQSRPAIGYLSQLEAMRYCEVGGYYKTPRFPIWVVGSTSHFTVMFGDAACLKETQSDMLVETCRRAFKAIDGGEENGFIPTDKLATFFKSLDLNLPDHGVQTLAATIEVHGAGIILWDDLWKHTSRLLMGATLETVLQMTDPHDSNGNGQGPPPLLTQFAEPEEMDRKPSAAGSNVDVGSNVGSNDKPINVDSDAEMAQRLSAEWSGDGSQTAASASAATLSMSTTSPMDVESTLSDEELARKLQEEWNAEASGGATTTGSVTAVRGSPTPSSWKSMADDTPNHNHNDTSNSNTNSNNESNTASKPEFEKYGKTFQLYHYNGLRGGALKPFRVTRMSAEEAVGASISLMGHSANGSHNGDLEDVIRTKWPSSMINWLGAPPPSID